jgi:hypothetical protein
VGGYVVGDAIEKNKLCIPRNRDTGNTEKIGTQLLGQQVKKKMSI